MKKTKSLLLFSGGLESTAIAYLYRPDYALTINYGQIVYEAEYKASKKIAELLGIQHQSHNCEISKIGFGELFGTNYSSLSEFRDWTPFRNQFLITIGSIFAIKLGVKKLIIGSVVDDQGYSDGTQEFIKNIKILVESQEGNIDVCAPGIELSSVELIKKSKIPLEMLLWSHSCTKNRYSCGICRSCKKRLSILNQLKEDYEPRKLS